MKVCSAYRTLRFKTRLAKLDLTVVVYERILGHLTQHLKTTLLCRSVGTFKFIDFPISAKKN